MRLLRTAVLSAAVCSFAATALFAVSAGAQEAGSMPDMHQPAGAKKPMPSPPMTAMTKLGGKDVTIKYNAPSMRGRKIVGADTLVPYGKIWRTGANPATTLVTETALKIGKLEVPAGTYTLYTVPAAPGTPWMLVINKQTGQWGTEYHQDQDLGRTEMMSSPLPTAQEVMSISFEKVHGKSAELHVRWENSDEWVKVESK